MGKIRGRRATTKKPKAFTYGRRGGNQAAQFGYLNFIQQQAHNIQVDALLREVNQAQAFTKRAVKEALDSVYDRSGPMDIDSRIPNPPNPPLPRQPPTPFTREVQRAAEARGLIRRRRMAPPPPQDMEDVRATISRAAPPDVVEATVNLTEDVAATMEDIRASIPSQGVDYTPGAAAGASTNPHPVYRQVTGGVYPPVPTREEMRMVMSESQAGEARRRAARAGTAMFNMGGLETTLMLADPQGTSRKAERAASLAPLPQRQRNRASDTYNAMVGSNFQRASATDTLREYDPATRDNKSRRVPEGSIAAPPLFDQSRFANRPHGAG